MHASRPYEHFEDAFWPGWSACGGYGSVRADGYDFVIVESGCRFAQPARLGDLIEVSLRPTAAGRSAFSVEMDLTRGGEAIATGSVTYVSVRDGAAVPVPV